MIKSNFNVPLYLQSRACKRSLLVIVNMNLPTTFAEDPRILDLMQDVQLAFYGITRTASPNDIINYTKKIVVQELTNYSDVLP